MSLGIATISVPARVSHSPGPVAHGGVKCRHGDGRHLLGHLRQALAQQRAFDADAGHEPPTPLTMLRAELELAPRPSRDRASLAAAVRAAAADSG